MRTRIGFGLSILSVLVGFVLSSQITATKKVGELQTPRYENALSDMGYSVNCDRCAFDHKERVFEVYTVSEIDALLSPIKELKTQIKSTQTYTTWVRNTGKKELESAITLSEQRLREEVKNSIDNIPSKLLKDEVKSQIKNEVIEELRAELKKLRQDLQAQIDELKEGN